MTEFVRVEQELAELTGKLQQSFKVLDDLAQVQQQFEALAQTHQKFQAAIDQSHTVLADLSRFKPNQDAQADRLNELEANLQTQAGEAADHISQLQAALGNPLTDLNGNRTTVAEQFRVLGAELTQKIAALKTQMDSQFAATLQATQRQRDATQLSIEATEGKVVDQLNAALEQVNQASASASYVEKLEVALRNTRSTLRETENRVGMMRNWLLVLTLGTIVALGLSIPATFLNPRPASLPAVGRSN